MLVGSHGINSLTIGLNSSMVVQVHNGPFHQIGLEKLSVDDPTNWADRYNSVFTLIFFTF